ncbi:hypothetical protein [Rhodococcoides kroppenstedtii]|uniref:hypothetical protein n=1 Tax=Rhodococcoides kroppenstedtii TaxID=293050 RepID=UPI0028EE06B5|nr:hypothetical protein [Rhodococcus kroppenstedtii]
MPSPTTDLRNSLDHIGKLRREFDAYEIRLDEWAAPGSVEQGRKGVGQRLAFQIGIYMRLIGGVPTDSPTSAAGLLHYWHFIRATLLVAEKCDMNKAVESYGELNDKLTEVGTRWLRDGVDETELAALVAEMQRDVERIAELGSATPPQA